MADDVFALSPISARAAQPSEADYEAIRDAFMETSRGRWFLGEYAKRNRNADTSMVLDAVARIEHALATREQQQEQEQVDERALPEALAAIRGAVEEAALATAAAVDRLALERNLAPVRKGTRIIKEISWRWREIGADSRICDLIDTQIVAIEAACDQLTSADPKAALLAAFEIIKARLNAFDDSEAAIGPASDESAGAEGDIPANGDTAAATEPPRAEAVALEASAPAEAGIAPLPLEAAASAVELADAVLQPATAAAPEVFAESAAPAQIKQHVASVSVGALPRVELDRAPASGEVEFDQPQATLEVAVEAAEIAVETNAASIDVAAPEMDAAAADAHDEAVLELVAAEMAAPDLIEDDDLTRVPTIGFDIQEPSSVDDDIVATFAEPHAPEPVVAQASVATPPAAAASAPVVAPEPRVVTVAPEPVPAAPVIAEPPKPAPPLAPQPAVAATAAATVQAMPKPSYEASLGSTLLANGLLQRKQNAPNDPLTPIRRMTQPEKVAFFS
ncbi:conserved hypothetical protein [Bradyrhizobium sp. STM 3843]|uniref:hypothetical protein n=1 Tax=Bradyrhizobium sp. STM 3843 TaxID=551947 RepID=UPI00024039E5|nr:hypothetical protein [Bradyrhizobium sp. STM 3843]CCE07837.1 conserved hypothetical protein [Bradyrhizobium sp. STM 3843]